MAYARRNEGPLDAWYNRAWTADVLASLAAIPAKHGDVAYVTASASWFEWVDTNAWLPMGAASIQASGAFTLMLMGG